MIVFLIGTKAQYIKMAPVLLAARARSLPHRLVLTGQHRETFADLQRNFGLPDPDLELVRGEEATDRSGFGRWLLAAVRAARGARGEQMLERARTVVVHGDTASTLLGAWIGNRRGVPVAHVEAGLRSFDYRHPFPEELVRVLVARRARLHFSPDRQASANLAAMQVAGEVVETPGNTLKDALRLALERGAPEASPTPYAVFSMHRHENLFKRARLARLLAALKRMAARLPVKFVLHPVTRRRLGQLGLMDELARTPGLELVPRLDYFGFVRLLTGAAFVATDGGSNQEECAMLGIPCLLLRKATERGDGLGAGVVLSGYDDGVIDAFVREHEGRRSRPRAPDGASPSALVVERLLQP